MGWDANCLEWILFVCSLVILLVEWVKKKKGKVAQVFREYFFIELKGQANLSEIEALSNGRRTWRGPYHRLTPTHAFNPNPSRPLSSSTIKPKPSNILWASPPYGRSRDSGSAFSVVNWTRFLTPQGPSAFKESSWSSSLARSFSLSLTHSLTHSLAYSISLSLTHSLTHSNFLNFHFCAPQNSVFLILIILVLN